MRTLQWMQIAAMASSFGLVGNAIAADAGDVTRQIQDNGTRQMQDNERTMAGWILWEEANAWTTTPTALISTRGCMIIRGSIMAVSHVRNIWTRWESVGIGSTPNIAAT